MSKKTLNEELTEALELIYYYQQHLEELVAQRTHELEVTKEMYHTLSKMSPIGLCRIDKDQKFEYCNRKFKEFIGIEYDDNENLEEKFIEAVHPTDRLRIVDAFQFMVENNLKEYAYEYRLRVPGTTEYRDVVGHSKRVNGGGKGWVATITCINNKKEILSELENIKNLRIKK